MPRARTALVRAVNIPRPTRTAALLFGFAILLELLGRLVGSTSITIAAAAALGAVIGDAALTPRLDGVTLSRHSPNRTTAGVAAPVRFVLAQPKRRHSKLPPVLLTDDHPAFTPVRVMAPEIPRGQQVVVSMRVSAPHRGYWDGPGDATLEAHSPLGGFVRKRSFTYTAERWVHPAPAAPVPLPDIALGTATGATGSGRTGHGMEFYGIREWRSGDGAASVHWRASARRNQLVVMERERPASAALVVLVGPATPGPDWELALARTAATAIAARRSGESVVLIHGGSSNAPDTARDVLDWFAALDDVPLTSQSALDSTLRQLGPGATVLCVATAAIPPQIAHLTRSAGATVVSVRTDPELPVRR